jgi:predicted permease
MNTFWHDLRYAVRQLRKAPGFTLTAVLTLALGIGANTAIFTLVHAIMLKALPVANPHQLYRVGDIYECCVEGSLQDDWTIFTYPLYQHLRDHTPQFESLAASQTNRPNLSVRREGSTAAGDSFRGEFVSGNFFSTLGVAPFVGRVISPQDDVAGAAPAVVMSYRAWQHYGFDKSLPGSSLVINGVPITLVGIAPPGFFGDRLESDPPDFWMPLALEPTLARENTLLNQRDAAWLFAIGRLRPGVNPAEVSAQMTVELQQWLSTPGNLNNHKEANKIKDQKIKIAQGATGVQEMADEAHQGLYLLMAASAVLLVIACANLANLLLARSAADRVRTSLQLAIGASRARIIRGKLTESVLLACVGGVAGLILAFNLTRAILLVAFKGSDFVPIDASPSFAVLGFTFAVSLVTGILFGVGPAWIASKSDPADALRSGSRSTRDRSTVPQKSLIILQAALSLVLLTIAGLVTMSLRNMLNQQFGFERQGRLVVRIDTKPAGYTPERLPELYRKIEDRLSHMPGVIAEGLALYGPQDGDNWGESVFVEGQKPLEHRGSSWTRMSVHYLDAIGAKILKGRAFDDRDTATSQKVAVVNENFVERFFPKEDPIGKHFGKDEQNHAGDYEIIGLVKNLKFRAPARKSERPFFFVALPQIVKYDQPSDQRVENASLYLSSIALHVAGDPKSYTSTVRKALAEIDPNLPIQAMRTYDEQIEINASQETLISRLSSLFGFLALALASVGLYGVTAYRVARRTNEVGIRMALGADRRNILLMVLREAFLQIGIGLLVGIPLVIAAGRLLSSQLFGVSAFHAGVLLSAILVLGLCALAATLLPARRAAAIEPMQALRTE